MPYQVRQTTTRGGRTAAKTILEEDEYVDALDAIIERDFFPDLPALRTQHAYLEAVEANDLARMQELKLRMAAEAAAAKAKSNSQTPSTQTARSRDAVGGRSNSVRSGQHGGWNGPATPSNRGNGPSDTPVLRGESSSAKRGQRRKRGQSGGERSDDGGDSDADEAPEAKRLRLDSAKLSLDKFQARYTSEDTASFEQIIEKDTAERVARLSHYLDAPEGERLLITGGGEEPDSVHALESWPFKAVNALMYHPDGLADSSKQKTAAATKAPKSINHSATRFQAPANRPPAPNAAAAAAAAAAHNKGGQLPGHWGLVGSGAGATLTAAQDRLIKRYDLREMNKSPEPEVPSDPRSKTPRVGGYGFVLTPSPAPGDGVVGESPFMTWGKVEGTPVLLDGVSIGGGLGSTPGPSFRLPKETGRARVARELSDAAARSARERAAGANASAAAKAARATPAATPDSVIVTRRYSAGRRQRTTPLHRAGAGGGGSSGGSSSMLRGSNARLAGLSPAARRLLQRSGSRAGSVASSLRASYGGGGGSSTPAAATPTASRQFMRPSSTTHRRSSTRVPGGGKARTPAARAGAPASSASPPSRSASRKKSGPSLSDNLLQI